MPTKPQRVEDLPPPPPRVREAFYRLNDAWLENREPDPRDLELVKSWSDELGLDYRSR